MVAAIDATHGDGPTGRVAVRVTKDAQRQIRGGHPWVYDSSVVSVRPDGRMGDLAVVFDDRRSFMAIGLLDPSSPIRIRILHHGRPLTIDESFWRERLSLALTRRGGLVDSTSTTAYRVVNGENDGLPGLVLDRYGSTGVLKLYSAAWCAHLAVIVPIVAEVLALETVVVRFSRQAAQEDTGGLADGDALLGDRPIAPVTFVENGLTFEADVVAGQKTGHFLDQRDNRLHVRTLAEGRRVLDVFSCTGGFSVNAAAGGATSVSSVDVNPHAIEAAKRNMIHNVGRDPVARCEHRTVIGDAFTVMEDLVAAGRRFDLVVVDPPSFASSAGQVPAALRSYTRLAELAALLVDPGGTLMQCSCSSRVPDADFFDAVRQGVAATGRTLHEESHFGHAVDHPIGFVHGGYLAALSARVDRP